MSNEVIGRYHSVETFGTVDGPGIRFVVFMQGCHLKCKYCHNRDTWDINAGCKITIPELMSKIERYIPYFESSNGGVTITGGEPLLQSEFVLNLFKALKEKNIHTTLDTSGIIKLTDNIKEILKYTDLVLLDIKHIDSKKAENLIGISNELEFEFAKYLSNNNIPIWIRQVIIPGITDDLNDLLKLKEFVSTLKTVQKIDLLAYHEMGKFKWEQIGQVYPLENVRPANDDDIKRAKEILGIEM